MSTAAICGSGMQSYARERCAERLFHGGSRMSSEAAARPPIAAAASMAAMSSSLHQKARRHGELTLFYRIRMNSVPKCTVRRNDKLITTCRQKKR